ncbi:MAG: HAD-IIIC family phosphatase [Muribaculaceae bacterium]
MFVFRNYTIENLFPEGTAFSGYGDISVMPESETELVWFYQVPVNFETAAQTKEVEAMKNQLGLVVARLKPGQTLYVLSLENIFPLHFTDRDLSLSKAVGEFNEFVLGLESSRSDIRFVNFSEYLASFPQKSWMVWRFYFISQMIFSPEVAAGFYNWFCRRKSQISGQRKKCLVLDLDNTLWGGVLGEDGVEGIKIGGDYPGNAFQYFQEGIVELGRRGVILAVCSKNNEADVMEAWKKNPFMKLTDRHFAAYRINWVNKADNIRAIAKELNLGLDSIVFVDDNPTERELIRQQLPMVTVPEFPKHPYGLMELLQKLVDKYFRAYELTAEDLAKTEQYKANARRSAAQHQFTDMNEFIRSLEIEINIIPADGFNIPRIAQMTQKTNQFNLTTRRYTDADIEDFVKRGYLVYCISVRDKFGDNGITGAIILNKEGKTAEVDTLLLSCRILGKGIETAFVKTVLNMLSDKGISTVSAKYIPTAKNSQVSDFYDRIGFIVTYESDGVKSYTFQLSEPLKIDDYYKINIK